MSTGPRKFEFIDSLRGLAFLGVLVCHLGEQLVLAKQVTGIPKSVELVFSHCDKGVQLFFLASALTLFLSLDSRRGGEKRPLLTFS